MSDVEQEQEQEQSTEQPSWMSIMRKKARAYDIELPELQADLAILRSDIDESNPSFGLWKADYANRVRAGQASWADPEAVKADAEVYGIVREAMPDHSVDAATQRRIEAVSEGAVGVDPKATARERMAQAPDLDSFLAAYRAQGGVVVED